MSPKTHPSQTLGRQFHLFTSRDPLIIHYVARNPIRIHVHIQSYHGNQEEAEEKRKKERKKSHQTKGISRKTPSTSHQTSMHINL